MKGLRLWICIVFWFVFVFWVSSCLLFVVVEIKVGERVKGGKWKKDRSILRLELRLELKLELELK